MVSDKVSNLITGLKNASMAGKGDFEINHNSLLENILEVLKKEEIITDFSVKEVSKGIKKISIEVKFNENGEPVINDVKRISKQSKRIYKSAKEIKSVKNGYGMALLTTPLGIMTNSEARDKKVGGEVLFEIW